ncbi:MAG: DUF3043 domain-containing protein [Mycobacteriales bacterium]
MKLRRTTSTDKPAAPVVVVKPGGKGRPTPKRTDAQKRRATTAAPTDRKQAMRKAREDAKARRGTYALAVASGDERNYPPMHAGKERALVRDVVDSRRSFGWLGIPSMFVLLPLLLIASSSPVLSALLNIPILALVGLIGWDYFAVRRRLKAVLAERYPTGTKESTRILVLYGVSRNNTFPTRRKPKPRVAVGDPV